MKKDYNAQYEIDKDLDKEFKLSEKMFKVEVPGVGWIWVTSLDDNQEFIRLLKEEVCICSTNNKCLFCHKIDNLSGFSE